MADGWRARALRVVEERLGLEVMPRAEAGALRESALQLETFAEEASDLAWNALQYASGRPQEMRPEYRNRLAQQSRIALFQDPLAGAEGDLRANFAFGRGVGMPLAPDEKIQEVIEDAWTDTVNQEKLTGFEAQRHRSGQLLTDANLYPTAFISEETGRVRLGFLNADTVTRIICDPEDDERPLYYAAREQRIEYDFVEDRYRTVDELDPRSGRPKLTYWSHWRNVEDIKQEAASAGDKLVEPPQDKLGKGVVFHVRINRIGRTQFGTPPFARTLRFYTAMNTLTEAHVSMAEAASSFIAKRTVRGGPKQVVRAANNVLAQTGEIAASRFGEGAPPPDIAGMLPPDPASLWVENEADTLQALNLNSGASQAAQTAQIVRAPIAASSQFGQHYLGDASNANLATSTSLELPTLMGVRAWQESFRQLLRWFTDLAIESALRAGRLGGVGAPRVSADEAEECRVESMSLMEAEDAAWERLPLAERALRSRPLRDLKLTEADDRRELERRTGRDLSYSLSMPYPGRRNLPDVVTAVTTVLPIVDPDGVNLPFRRAMLNFLATHGLEVDDPASWVDMVLPEEDAPTLLKGFNPATGEPYAPGEKEAAAAATLAKATQSVDPGNGGPSGETPAGARGQRDTSQGGGALRASLEDLGEDVASLFETAVREPLLR